MMQCGCGLVAGFLIALNAALVVGTPVPQDPKVPSQFENLPLLVPDIKGVDSELLKEVQAEKYFNLWTVFVSGRDVMLSDEAWTLLVPLNTGLPKDKSFLSNAEHTRNILLNHVILGDSVDILEVVNKSVAYYSLAHTEIVFSEKNGEYFANNIRLTGDEFQLGKSTIYLIEEFLPLDQPKFLDFIPEFDTEAPALAVKNDIFSFVDNEEVIADVALPAEENKLTESSQKAVEEIPQDTASRPTRFDKFRSKMTSKKQEPESPAQNLVSQLKSKIETEDDVRGAKALPKSIFPDIPKPKSDVDSKTNTNALNNKLPSPKSEKADAVMEFEPEFDILENNTFIGSLVIDLEADYSNGQEFIHHFLDVELDLLFEDDGNYTALVPTDDAFYDYYPIDWGFNPFQVANFTKDVLTNLILPGNVDLYSLANGTQLKALGGRTIILTKNEGNDRIYLNDELIPPEGEILLSNGRFYFLDKILFVDYQRVNELRNEYPYLETGPLLSFPWPTSPFLSHLLKRLQENSQMRIFAELLMQSNIAHLVSSIDQNLNRQSYTAFVPKDDILQKTFSLKDIETLDNKVINSFLMEHLFYEYIMEDELIDGTVLKSLSGNDVAVKVTPNEIFVGQSKILEPQQFLYNLGAIYIIDEPLVEKLPNVEEKSIDILARTDELKPQVDKQDEGGIMVPFLEGLPLFADSPDITHVHEEDADAMAVLEKESAAKVVDAEADPEIIFETRTEVSFSKQINDGEIVPISKDFIMSSKGL